MKKEIAILASVALGSMAVGFLLVVLILGPGEGRTLPDPFADGDSAGPGPAPDPTPPAESDPAGHGKGSAPAAGAGQAGKTQPTPAPPAQAEQAVPASGELALDVGDPFVWRCWAEGQSEPMEKDLCGDLPGVGKLVTDNLGVIEDCVVDHAGQKASGKLSLALKVDFTAGRVKAWLGNSTTVAEMESISACLRTGFEAKLPPPIDHDHPSYIVFFTIDVG